MHLYELQMFSDRYGIDITVEDFLQAVTQASLSATQDLASRFRLGELGVYGTRRDCFYVDNMSRQGEGNLAEFYLSRPFVTTFVRALYTPNPIHIRNEEDDSFTDISDVAEDGKSNYGALDFDRGVFTVFGINVSHQWVCVEYSGGFEVNSDDVFQNVPDWLVEAAMSQTAINLANHVMFQTEDEGNELESLRPIIARLYRDHARLSLSPMAYRPRFTDIVPPV